VTERSLNEAKASGDDYWYLKFRLKKVEILISQSRMAEAAKLLDTLELPHPENGELTALLATQRGWLCYRTRRPKCAVENLLTAEAAANSGGFTSLLPIIELKLGNAYVQSAQMTQAEEHFRKAAKALTMHSDAYTRLSIQGALGFLLIQEKRYDEAIQVIERALDASKSSGTRMIRANNLLNLGDSYSQVGDAEHAAPLLDQASKIFTELKRPDGMHLTLVDLGDTALQRGDLRMAEDSFHRAATLARSAQDNVWLAESLSGLVTVALERGNHAAAGQFQAQVSTLLKGEHIAELNLLLQNSLNAARIAQASGDLVRAKKLFQDAASKGAVDWGLALEAQARLAQLLEASGKPVEAEAAFRTALQRFDVSRSRLLRDESKLAYDSALIYLFQQYVEFLASRGRHAEAFELAESSRARLLVEQRVAAAGSHIAQFRALAARSKATLLFYWTGPQRSWLWMVTPSATTPFQLPPEDKLKALAAAYRQETEGLRDPLVSQGSAGWQLSAALLDPVRSALGKNARVIAVPDGSIFDINLESLPVDKGRPHYFIEDAEVTVVPSLSLLLDRLAPQNHTFRMLAVGDIVSPDKTRYPDLANATAEIQSLTTLFPGAITTRTRSDAAPGAYRDAKPAQYSIIHFATHAESNRVDPLDSAVILSRQGDQFKLYARDIQKLRITAELVTISSCSSAGSRTYAGEGLVGFAWAFLAAGARNVVAGLWDVDDRSTATLMKGMYDSLKRGARPSEALRQTQLELVRSQGPYRKPYYWAPFEVFARTVD